MIEQIGTKQKASKKKKNLKKNHEAKMTIQKKSSVCFPQSQQQHPLIWKHTWQSLTAEWNCSQYLSSAGRCEHSVSVHWIRILWPTEEVKELLQARVIYHLWTVGCISKCCEIFAPQPVSSDCSEGFGVVHNCKRGIPSKHRSNMKYESCIMTWVSVFISMWHSLWFISIDTKPYKQLI